MRKALSVFLLCTLLFLAVVGVCWTSAARLPTLRTGDRLEEAVLSHNTRLLFQAHNPERTILSAVLYPAEELAGSDLHLVIADIRSFCLSVNGETVYRFEGTPASKRLHDIPLEDVLRPGQPLELQIEGSSLMRSIRCLIGGGEQVRMYTGFSFALTLLLTGIYIAIAVNCLSLYFRKRSERYLLHMTWFTLTVGLTGVLYSNLPIPVFPLRDILHMGYLHAISQTLALILCAKLLHLHPFRKRETSYPLWLLLAAVAAVFVLNRLSYSLRAVFLELIFFVTVGLVGYACWKNRPCANTLLVGIALSGGLTVYNACVNYGLAMPTLLMHYIHLPAFYSMILDFFCLAAVNSIFSQKFKEAEALITVVEASNRELDEKVRLRTAELEEANQQLRQEQLEKHAMMTNLFHDLRSPLFCAMGYSEIIASKCGDVEEIGILRRQLTYLSHLTEELFLIAKLEDRQITFAAQPVDLSRICAVIAEELRPEADSQGKTLSTELGEKILVTGDGFRLRQAIENLAVNAISHTPAGTHVRLVTRRSGDQAQVLVADNGQGIPPDNQAHLFDRYYSKSPSNTGTGLGLPIAREILEAHAGSITVESTPGQGSCFTLSLPLRQETEEQQE